MAKAEWYERKDGKAEHLVYLNKKAQELEKLIKKEKSLIIRGAAGKKCPLGGRAMTGDTIFFVETGGDMTVTHKGVISNVIESAKMTVEESIDFVNKYKKELNLSKEQYDKWAGKKYLGVYEIAELTAIEPFKYNREKNMDDWIIVDDIEKIKL